jgi:lysyl-tRNA synthetase class 2
MSLELKNKTDQGWSPTASLQNMKARADLLEKVRAFFKERGVLEVETPLLAQAAATHPYLRPIMAFYSEFEHSPQQNFYLQTSPEFAMKRILAAFPYPIYQICKAFRNGEVGRYHNPEFTMLEWYRPHFNHHDLMNEMDDFLSFLLDVPKAERVTYESIFLRLLDINPHTATLSELKEYALTKITINAIEAETLSKDDWLDLLMTHCIESNLGFDHPVMIYDFPASQAALAKVSINDPGYPLVAERFEVYVKGIELANGYHELTDPLVQLKRFEEDTAIRERMGLSTIPIDYHLVNALQQGLPSSAGVALGIDRLLMLKLDSQHIEEVIAFTIDRA